ncbi:MAG TPA: ChbG/HpnK family deacetylase [Vicinamibacteria bacterium]|nr:ChbG/HpnK family deacetylase [Vicinamibacteria bacterium]
MKRLVVTADDFGLSLGVVAGIVEAHQRGIVTATSLMVNAPAAQEAFRQARARPSLSIGLHFVLTFGEPVGPREALGALLGEDGRFRRWEAGERDRVSPDQVREELRAQLRRFENGVGRPPSHIDGHHHVHAIPGVLTAVIEEARGQSIPVRSPDVRTRSRLRREGIPTDDHFVETFYGEGFVGESHLLEILRALEEGTSELMCHPAAGDDTLASLTGYLEPRYEELRTLTSERVRRALMDLGIELTSR